MLPVVFTYPRKGTKTPAYTSSRSHFPCLMLYNNKAMLYLIAESCKHHTQHLPMWSRALSGTRNGVCQSASCQHSSMCREVHNLQLPPCSLNSSCVYQTVSYTKIHHSHHASSQLLTHSVVQAKIFYTILAFYLSHLCMKLKKKVLQVYFQNTYHILLLILTAVPTVPIQTAISGTRIINMLSWVGLCFSP